MRLLALWRWDGRCRRRLWQLRFPALLGSPARVRCAAVALLAVAHLLIFSGAAVVCHLVSPQRSSSEIIAAGLAAGLLLAASIGLSAANPAGPRGVVVSHDLDVLQLTNIRDRDVLAARLWRRDAVVILVALSGLIAPVAEAMVMVTGNVAAVVAALLVTLGCLVCRLVGMLFALVMLRGVLALPPIMRGPATIVLSVLAPLATTGVVLVLGAAVVPGGAVGLWSPEGMVASLSRLLDDHATLAMVVAGLAGATVLLGALCWSAMRTVDLLDGRRRLTKGVRWRVNRPFAGSLSRTVGDKDLRTLVRRGPVAWEVAGGLLDVLPALAVVSIGLSAFPEGAGPGTHWAVVIGTAVALCGFLGVAGETLADLSSMDADGPIRNVLRSHSGRFGALVGARASRHAITTYFVGLCCLVILAVGGRLHPSVVMGLVLTVGLLAVIDGVCLAVGSARYPALVRPTLGQPELEPQVRLLTGMGALAGASMAGVVLLAMSRIPLPAGIAGYLWPVVIAGGLVAGVRLLARRVAYSAYLRWEETPNS